MINVSRIFNIVSALAIATVVLNKPSYAANWDDAGVNPVQSISDHKWRDANTGRLISTKGMPNTTQTTAAAAQTVPATTAVAAGTRTAPGNAAKTAVAAKATKGTKWGNLSRKGKMVRGLAVIGGGLMMYEGTVGNGPHSWSDVIMGASGGIGAGATIGTSVGGPYGTVIGVAAGAVVGGSVGGAKFFSESGKDCVYDEMLPNVYTCCATVFNKGVRYVDIGGTMLCEMPDGNPGVRTCLNGDSTTTHSIFKNDHWGDCQAPDTMWCPGVQKPASDDGVLYVPTLDNLPEKAIQKSKIAKGTDENQLSEEDLKQVKVCWDWVCDDTAGYSKQGNICTQTMEPAPSTDENTVDGMLNYLERLRSEILNDCGTLGQ